MTTSFSFSEYQSIIASYWNEQWPHISECNKPLQPMLAHHFQTSGKLLRPTITIAFYETLLPLPPDTTLSAPSSLSLSEDILQTALAIELLHNGTLVHDDLQDGDDTRRNQPTVWKAFSPYQAINTGSALYFHTQRLLSSLSLPPKTVLHLIALFAEKSLAIVAGQAAEYTLWERLSPKASYEDACALYTDVVEKKTSALFTIPLVSAAILAGESALLQDQLLSVAHPLGTLFQIQDDVLDLFGNKGRETPGNDIAEGKPTRLVLHALYHASPVERRLLQEILRQPRHKTSPSMIQDVIQIIEKTGSLRACIDLLEALQKQAIQQCKALSCQHGNARPTECIESLLHVLLQPIAHLN